MKFYSFTFKNDAIWTMIFSLAPAVIGTLIMLLVALARRLT